jgi:hypothetical protein
VLSTGVKVTLSVSVPALGAVEGAVKVKEPGTAVLPEMADPPLRVDEARDAFDPAQKLPPGGVPQKDLRELASTNYDPSDWGLSPDGNSIAMVRPSSSDSRIHVIPLQRHDRNSRSVETAPVHDVLVQGWRNLFNLNWAADGAGWYICSRSDPAGSTFLYVDLKRPCHRSPIAAGCGAVLGDTLSRRTSSGVFQNHIHRECLAA